MNNLNLNKSRKCLYLSVFKENFKCLLIILTNKFEISSNIFTNKRVGRYIYFIIVLSLFIPWNNAMYPKRRNYW